MRATIVLALAGAIAGGANLTISGVNRAEFWAFLDTLLTEGDADTLVHATHMEDKLDLNVRYGDLKGQLGMFLYEPSKPWVGGREPLRLLDYTIAYSPKRFEVLYGKFFQSFGKGLALRTYSDDDFRHYKSLHGLRGTASLTYRTDVVAFGARMRDIFFQENVYHVMNFDDTTDQVYGANLASRPVTWGGFGGRYVRINGDDDLASNGFTELYGGDLTLSFGPIEVYGEVCQRMGTKPIIGGRERGIGYYATGTFAMGWFSLLGQYMDYDKLGFPDKVYEAKEYRYNDPPTPIKSGVAMNRGVDERGFGVVATGTPIQSLYLEADLGRLYTHDDSSAGVVEWEGKARYNPVAEWTFEAYFNHMLQRNVELGTYNRVVDKPVVHVNYLVGQHTFAFEGEVGLVDERSTRGDSWDYLETALALSYGYGEALLFTLGIQHVDVELQKRYNGETFWPMFEAVWSITHRNMLRVRVGAERGGYTCSGGVCRDEPPFRGIKAQLISRF